jgi:hypothetical protein
MTAPDTESRTRSPETAESPTPTEVIEVPEAAERRESRRRQTPEAREELRASRVKDALLALLLASLLAYYIDFKIRKEQTVRVDFAEVIEPPEGLEGLEITLREQFAMFPVSGPTEALARLKHRDLVYRFDDLSRLQVLRELEEQGGEGATIVYALKLSDVEGLPDGIDEAKDRLPDPDEVSLQITPVQTLLVGDVEVVNQEAFKVEEGFVPDVQPARTNVEVKVYGLADAVDPGACTLYADASRYRGSLHANTKALALSEFDGLIVRCLGSEHPAEVLAKDATLDVDVRPDLVERALDIPLVIHYPEGYTAGEPLPAKNIRIRFKVPRHREEQLVEQLRDASISGVRAPLRAYVIFPMAELEEKTRYQLVKDLPEDAHEMLQVAVLIVPEGVVYDGVDHDVYLYFTRRR